MQISTFVLAVFLATSAFAKGEKARCFPADTVATWEVGYCLSTTGADDGESEVAKECLAKLRKDKAVPKKRCARIVWLKDKACQDDPSTGNTRKACLSDKDYLKKIESNPPYVGS